MKIVWPLIKWGIILAICVFCYLDHDSTKLSEFEGE